MSNSLDLSNVQPKAVMTDAEIAAWEALPATVQLERLRAAIDKGINGPRSTRTVGEIFQAALAKHRNASL